MEIYDISMNINYYMPVYKNKDEKRPIVQKVQDFSIASSYESKISMDMHTGTHMDSPLHMIEDGDTIDSIKLERVITNCKVFDFTHIDDKITKEDLQNKEVKSGDFLILKTKNSFIDKFDPNFVYLERSGAQYLKEMKINGVGIDALGIERSQPEHETHKLLLGDGIIILEGLRLSKVQEGEYFLIAPPLKISNVEAAPTRAILLKFNS